MSQPTETIDNNDDIFMNDFHAEEQKQLPPQPPPAASEMSESTRPLSVKASQELNFMDKVKKYVAENRTRVYILTPCYGSQCYVNYVSCLMNTMVLFNQLGLVLRVEFCRNDSLVSRARNNLIAKAMSDKNITHMLFIDADITWNPVDILKLILADKNIVGGVYPIKNYEWNKLIDPTKNVVQEWIDKKNASQLKDAVSDQDILQHRLMRYNLNYNS
jgi:hypothetical protein